MLEIRGRFVGTLSSVAVTASLFAGCSAGDPSNGTGSNGILGGPSGGSGGAAAGAGTGSSGSGAGGFVGQGAGPGSGDIPIIDEVHKPDPNDRDGGCRAAVSQGELLPLDIYIMFDQSQSMQCAVQGGSRWTATKTALDGFVNNAGARGIGVGIQYFGQGGFFPLASSCEVGDYSRADVPIAPLPANAAAITDSLGRHGPTTNTPSRPALEAAIGYAADWKRKNPAHTVIVLFVTDGQPNSCNVLDGGDFVQPVADVAARGFALPEKVQTYVVGVISPDTPCASDPNPPTQADLDRVAQAGGTKTAFMVDVNTNASQKFLDAMNAIRAGAQAACEYKMPTADAGERIDPGLVNVNARSFSGTDSVIFRVNGAAACDPTKGGWHYDDEANPTKILLCPASCTGVAQVGTTVSVKFGCVPSERPPQ